VREAIRRAERDHSATTLAEARAEDAGGY
jgi:hypothetical protein